MNEQTVQPLNFNYELLLDTTLKNNAKLTIYNYNDDTGLFANFVNVGSKYEVFNDYSNKEKTDIKIISGLAHLIEHLMFSFDDKDTKNNLNIRDAVYNSNGYYNASTDDTLTTYYFNCLNDNIIDNIKIYFNIFKQLAERFTESKIKTEIEAINNEQKKNFSFEFNIIYSIIQQLSDNPIFAHNTCGTRQTLAIENIINFIKLFYKTFYIPDNFRFVLIINKYKINIDELLKVFNDFSNFYNKEFINLMLQPLPLDFPFSLNKGKIDLLSNNVEKLKSGKMVNIYDSKINKLILFGEFKVNSEDFEYIKFISWLLNRKDKRSLTDILKSVFNIPSFRFKYLNYSTDSYIFIITVYLTKDIILNNQLDVLIYTIQKYLNTLKSLDYTLLTEKIKEYKINNYFTSLYSREFSVYKLDTILNDTIYANIKINFNCSDILLNQYIFDFKFSVDKMVNLLKQLDLRNYLFILYSNNKNFSQLKEDKLKISENLGYNIKFYIEEYKQNIKADNQQINKQFFILDKKEKDNYKDLLNINNDNIVNCNPLNIKMENIEFHETNINNINIKYKINYYTCYESSLIFQFKINFTDPNYNQEIINYLLIFEYINYIINREYNFLDSTNFIFNYSFDSFKNNTITFYYSVLNEYFIKIFMRLIDLLKSFINQDKLIKEKIIKITKYLIEKLKKKLNEELVNNKIGDRYKLKGFYFSDYFNIYEILNNLNKINVFDDYKEISINNVNIFVNFPISRNEETDQLITLFLNTCRLSLNNLIKEDEKYIKFNVVKPKEDNEISFFNSSFKSILKIPSDNYVNFKAKDNLNLIEKITPLDKKDNRNYLLSVNVILPFKEIIKDDFIIYIIRERLSKTFFNYFRVYKKYSYFALCKSDNLNDKTILLKMLLIVDKDKINKEFIFNYYDEIKDFLYSQINYFESLKDYDIINMQNSYYSLYNKKFDNSLYELIDYSKKYEKYKKIYKENEIIQLTNIKTDELILFYRKYFIDKPFNLIIYEEDE